MIWNRIKRFVLLLDNYPEFRIRFDKAHEDQSSLSFLSSLVTNRPFLPVTKYSLSPHACQLILNDILIHDRKCVVELGSGFFTVLLARLIKQNELDIKFYSVDNDPNWRAIVKSWLDRENLDTVQLISAPLSEGDASIPTPWYEQKILDKYFKDIELDTLIIDGPQSTTGLERAPAMAYFNDKMSKTSFSIFLDDAHRKGERQVLRNWQRDFALAEQVQIYGNRIGVILKNSPYFISPTWHSYNSIKDFKG